MELQDTAKMMISEDYKERFKSELAQAAIRLKKLKTMLEEWDDGKLNFTPTCPRYLYDRQVAAMEEYVGVLTVRAALEDVDLRA